MKKLGRNRGTVHPSPPTISDHLAFLPAYLLALAASLSPADLEVLAYIISANNADETIVAVSHSKRGSRKNPSSTEKPGGIGRSAGSCSVGGKGGDAGDHDPNFCCDCFRCYMSYWVRWDTSSNRKIIDEIIEAYEFGMAGDGCGGNNVRGGKGRKERRKGRGVEAQAAVVGATATDSSASARVGGGDQRSRDMEIRECDREEGGDDVDGADRGDEAENGQVRRLVSFIGERIWGAWN